MEITPQELKQMMDDKKEVVLLDVREEDEFRIANIDGCTLIPMSQFMSRMSELNPDDEIVTYCHHGPRSIDVANHLSQNGFTNVKSLSGGIDRWSLEIDPNVPRY